MARKDAEVDAVVDRPVAEWKAAAIRDNRQHLRAPYSATTGLRQPSGGATLSACFGPQVPGS
jgi:hypothetical protein